MAITSLTAANCVFTLAVTGLFPPVRLQGFATDDVFATNAMASAEAQMGVDGKLSAGFVYVPVEQSITLQGDSISNDIFDTWWRSQTTAAELFPAVGLIVVPAIRKQYAMNKGFLTSFPPLPDAKKLLQPRKFGITWESINPSTL
ncbi:MAG: hypothetical protein GC190_19360 [Alphaproteobacteria bacterium]|nr:hypothetical protein [Alphaproteobacteria bacterium]